MGRRDERPKGPPAEGTVVSVGMQKGGVAKTTNATHLAAALAERGRRVLLWDVDENAGATKLFRAGGEGVATTYEVLTGETPVSDAIQASDGGSDGNLPPGLDLLPSSRKLTFLDAALAKADPFYSPNDCLRGPIEELRALGHYDYILLDTGPSAATTTRSAYMVSEFFILSLIPEKLAMDGLKDALEDIARARQKGRNPALDLLGLILSCMDRRKALARLCEKQIAERFKREGGGAVKFRTTIGTAAAIDRAAYQGKTLLQVEPKHRVSKQYRGLAREVEERIGLRRRGSSGATGKARAHG